MKTKQHVATPEATAAYADQYHTLTYQTLGSTGLKVSQAGFGTYRVDQGVEGHDEALLFAMEMGVNLIDTSSNYADGGSETLLGYVISHAIQEVIIKREQLVVVSKGGYIQGKAWSDYQAKKDTGTQWPETTEMGPGFAHCIHPDFLQDQLYSSLSRLQLDCIDVYLLHNPEYFLSDAHKQGQSLDEARAAFYERVKKAFVYLESAVAAGHIQYYGVSANTLGAAADQPDFVSAESLLNIAKDVSPDHHFRVLQAPLNLLEPGVITEPSHAGKSLAQFVQDHQLALLANRPLNALKVEGNAQKLIRLADYDLDEPVSEDQVMESVQGLLTIESTFKNDLIDTLNFESDQQKTAVPQQLFLAESLAQNWSRFSSLAHWQETMMGYVIPNVERGINTLTSIELSNQVTDWVETYLRQINEVMNLINQIYKEKAMDEMADIRQRVCAADADWAGAETSSQMAIRACRSSLGVSSVLVGMRHIHYVEDVLSELAKPVPVADRAQSWDALNRAYENA